MSKSARRLALVAATLLVLAQGAAMASTPLRLTKPVRLTKDDVDPARMYMAPSLAVNPANQLQVVAGMTELRSKRCSLMRSVDGGQTWTRLDTSPMPDSYPFCNTNNRGSYQSQVAFGRNGVVYDAFPAWDVSDGNSRGNNSVLVARSTNLGDTWQVTTARDNRGKQGNDQENIRPVGSIAVDAKSGSQDAVYVGYSARITNATAPNAVPNQPIVIASTDGGRTFADPVDLAPTIFDDPAVRTAAISATTVPPPPTSSTTVPPASSKAAQPNQVANFGGFQPVVTVGANGTVYAVWPASSANITPSIPTGIMVSRSTDKGKTWTTTQVGTFSYTNGSFLQMAWSPGGGSQGTLHLVYPGSLTPTVGGQSDIFYLRSTDGGKTWTDPKNLTDDDPQAFYGQYYPNVTVSPNGNRVDVAWYDTRDDIGIRSNDVYYAYSTDDGKTWSKNTRATDQSIDRRFGVWSNGYDVTSPPSLASADAYTILGWDDTRNTDKTSPDAAAPGGGSQDIYTTDVQFRAVGGGASKAAKVALAGVLGLFAVGLVLVIVSLAGRRATGAGHVDQGSSTTTASVT
ncbi:MAG: hypothetical protein ABR511_11280 [Acidimicrobiales bacterium]